MAFGWTIIERVQFIGVKGTKIGEKVKKGLRASCTVGV